MDFERSRLVVYASKTDSTRIVPVIPALLAILRDAFDQAIEGTMNLVTLSSSSTNIHRGMEKIITRAGIVPWDDLLQTLRRSAETDFAKRNPQHAVSRWIGHSMAVSERHYLQVDEELLEAATRSDCWQTSHQPPTSTDSATTYAPSKRAAESAAVGVRKSSQVQETRRNDDLSNRPVANPSKAEIPCKNRGFRDWDRSDLNREPKDYESAQEASRCDRGLRETEFSSWC